MILTQKHIHRSNEENKDNDDDNDDDEEEENNLYLIRDRDENTYFCMKQITSLIDIHNNKPNISQQHSQ